VTSVFPNLSKLISRQISLIKVAITKAFKNLKERGLIRRESGFLKISSAGSIKNLNQERYLRFEQT